MRCYYSSYPLPLASRHQYRYAVCALNALARSLDRSLAGTKQLLQSSKRRSGRGRQRQGRRRRRRQRPCGRVAVPGRSQRLDGTRTVIVATMATDAEEQRRSPELSPATEETPAVLVLVLVLALVLVVVNDRAATVLVLVVKERGGGEGATGSGGKRRNPARLNTLYRWVHTEYNTKQSLVYIQLLPFDVTGGEGRGGLVVLFLFPV